MDEPMTMMADLDVPGSAIDLSDDLMVGLAEMAAAHEAYVRAEDYYTGNVPEFFASVRLRRAMARTGVGFHFNFSKTPVEAVCDRLEIAAVTSTDPAASTEIETQWEHNKLDLGVPNIHRRAGEYGDCYTIVWPDPDDERLIDIMYNSPLCCRIVYDDERPNVKLFAIKQWELVDERRRVNLYYPDRIEKYVTVKGAKGAKAKDWKPFELDGEPWPVPNPYGEIPVFHYRTDPNNPVPEHKDAYGPQDAIRKMIISHMASADYQAFPQRYALGDGTLDSSEAAAADEDEFNFPLDTGATSQFADARSQYTADPGSLWYMQGIKTVGQFDQADPGVFMGPLEIFLRCMAQITNTPLHYFDPSGDAPSGESLRTAEGPFVKKIGSRQLSYGATHREQWAFVLKLRGLEGADVHVRWAQPASVDDQSWWQTAGIRKQLGVPQQQILLEAGYTEDQAEQWLAYAGDENLAQQVEMLATIGHAAQSLGTAVGFGVLSAEQVNAIIMSMINAPGIVDLPGTAVADDGGAEQN